MIRKSCVNVFKNANNVSYILGCSESSVRFLRKIQMQHIKISIYIYWIHDPSSSFTQLEYSSFPKPLRFFGEKLLNIIFYVGQTIKVLAIKGIM